MESIKSSGKLKINVTPDEYAGICSTKELLHEVVSSDYLHENVVAAARDALYFLDLLTMSARQHYDRYNITMWIS